MFKGHMVNERTKATQPVAVKFMYEDLPPEAIDRARREASMQFRNDNLVQMLAFIETQGTTDDGNAICHYHVVSELLRGVTLSDALQGKLVDYEGVMVDFASELMQLYYTRRDLFAARVVKSVLAGLMALHDAGYIHRDIDPSNIMLTADGHIKLIDFGVARRMDSLSQIEGERLFGKPAYAAPELIRGETMKQNVTTDTYAVGILLYQLLCGTLPFTGDFNQVMKKQLSENVIVGNIPYKWLQSVVKRATEKQQDKRFQSAAEFRVALDKESPLDNDRFPWPMFVMGMCLLGLAVGVVAAFLT